jgi:hypothetical protein
VVKKKYIIVTLYACFPLPAGFTRRDGCACRARRDRLVHTSVGAVTAAVTAVEPFKFHRAILPVLS